MLLTRSLISKPHFLSMAQQPPVGQGLLIIEASRSHSDTPHSYNSSGQVVGPAQRPLPGNNLPSQQTDIHVPGGILTHNPSRPAADEPRLRPRGQLDRRTRHNKNINRTNPGISSRHMRLTICWYEIPEFTHGRGTSGIYSNKTKTETKI